MAYAVGHITHPRITDLRRRFFEIRALSIWIVGKLALNETFNQCLLDSHEETNET